MTPVESGLTFWAVIGLAGCAAALVALVRDWRDEQMMWRASAARADAKYTLEFGDPPLAVRQETPTYWTTTSKPGWQAGETKPVDDPSLPKAGA